MSRLAVALALLASVPAAAADWPGWRGPTRDGVAPAGPLPPLTWSETKNVRWKVPVPGRGHGSPAVVGSRVYLTAAEPDAQLQSVLCFDRDTGKQLWKTVVHEGGFEQTTGNAKSSFASSTPYCDGERVYATFMHGKTVTATALGLDGKQLWQQVVSGYVLHQGYGSSPAVYKNLLLVTADNKGGGVVAGLDRATGAFVWKHDRPKLPNYASPIVLGVAGKDQLVLTGCDLVSAFDPLTGSKLWETKGSTTECVTSPVTDGRRVFTSGGYPTKHVSAVAADGGAKVVWANKSQVYVPSMLVKDGHLYAVQDDGFAVCWRCDTGAERWREKIGGTFSSSPVLVGDRIYTTSEAGKTVVFKADPAGFEQLGEAKLGDEVLTTPAVCDGRVYTRVAVKAGGKREEFLYCLGE